VALSAGVRDVYDTYGGAWADYDNDSDLDLVTGARPIGGASAPKNVMLFRNEMYNPVSNQLNNSWLKVKLKGCGSNSCAIGARVNVTNGSVNQIREVEAGTGAHSQQNSMVLNFGWGDYYSTVNLTIKWPNGVNSSVNGVSLNQTIFLKEANCTSPPTNVTANLWGPGNSDLNITWTLSVDDGAGFDNDGWLDLWAPQIYDTSYSYAYLYHNNQNGTFEDVALSAGVRDVYDTYGGAWADYDNDGDLDLVTGARPIGGASAPKNIMLFRNEMYNPVSNQLNNSWLKVKLKGCGSNSCAIGARVNVTNGSMSQIREVEAGTGAHSQQNSMVLNFGFGSYYGNVDASVRWPSGVVSSLTGIALNQTLNLMEANCTAPPTNLTATFWSAGNDDLNITWTLSIDDGAGLDNVANYAIYHSNTSYDRSGMFYEFLAEIPNGINFYVHPGKGMVDTENHFYLVKANSTLGFQTWGTQTAKISQFLQQGKNLISLPISPYDDDISVVLQTVNYNSAWWFDPLDALNPWKSYNPLKSFNNLGTINHTMGVWIDAASDGYLMVTGSVPTATDIELKMGWNLIGYPSFKQDNVSKALSAVPYERIEGFNASVPEKLQLCNDSDIMNAGYGYWIKVSADATLTIMQV